MHTVVGPELFLQLSHGRKYTSSIGETDRGASKVAFMPL
jgi:hypothetical protein